MSLLNTSSLTDRLKALPRSFERPKLVNEGISLVAAFAVGALLNLLLKKFWVRVYGHEAPANPSTPGVKWSEAVGWGLATGAAAGVAKVVARRGADVASARLA